MPSGLFNLLRVNRDRRAKLESLNNPNYRTRALVPEAMRRALSHVVVRAPQFEAMDVGVVPGARLAPASSWACQYQQIKPADIAICPADVVIIDPTDGSREGFFKPAEVDSMRAGLAGRAKKLIGYMSIGEAETYRFYWEKNWVSSKTKSADAPAWLHAPNSDDWAGNWTVRFWDPGWQDIIINRPDSFLNRIIDAGFDGVFLDVVDVYSIWMEEVPKTLRRPTAADEMVTFIARIAEHARVKRGKPGFAVVPINGDRLLVYPQFRAAISAIGKENIYFDQVGKASGIPHVRQKTDAEVEETVARLRLAIADRIPVLSMEYLIDWKEDRPKIAPTVARMRRHGFVPHFPNFRLDTLADVTLPEGDARAIA